jgi:hypothetical protein
MNTLTDYFGLRKKDNGDDFQPQPQPQPKKDESSSKKKKSKKTKQDDDTKKKKRKRDSGSEEESPKKKKKKDKKDKKKEKKEKKKEKKKRERSEESNQEEQESPTKKPKTKKKEFDTSTDAGKILKMIDVFGLVNESEENLKKEEVQQALLASYANHHNNKYTKLSTSSPLKKLAVYKRKDDEEEESTLTPVSSCPEWLTKYELNYLSGTPVDTKLECMKKAVQCDYFGRTMDDEKPLLKTYREQLNFLIATKPPKEGTNALTINTKATFVLDPPKDSKHDSYHQLIVKEGDQYHSFVDQDCTQSKYKIVVLPTHAFIGKQPLPMEAKREEFRVFFDVRTSITDLFVEPKTTKRRRKPTDSVKTTPKVAVVVAAEDDESSNSNNSQLEDEEDEIAHGPKEVDIAKIAATDVTVVMGDSSPQAAKPLRLSLSKQKKKDQEKKDLFTVQFNTSFEHASQMTKDIDSLIGGYYKKYGKTEFLSFGILDC